MALYFRTTNTASALHPDAFAEHLSEQLKALAGRGDIVYKGSLDTQALRHGSLEVRHGQGLGGQAIVEAELAMHVLKDASQLSVDYRLAGKLRTVLMVVGLVLLGWLNVQIFLRPETVSLLSAAMVPGIALALVMGLAAGLFRLESNRLHKLLKSIASGQTSLPDSEQWQLEGANEQPATADAEDGEYDPTAAFKNED